MKMGVCKHYNYKVRNKGVCTQGVDVRALVLGRKSSWISRIPCIKSHTGCKPCTRYKEPTPADILAKSSNTWLADQVNLIMLANKLVVMLKKRHAKGHKGYTKCPACKAKLGFTVSSFNGKTSGRCKTRNCIKWSE